MRNRPAYLIYFITLYLFSVSAFAESADNNEFKNLHKGIFLVASDQLDYTSMRQTVVYVIQHDEGGTSGVIINRPTNLSINEAFPETDASNNGNGTLFFGGPLHTQYLFMLTETKFTQGLFAIDQGIYFGTGDEIKMRLQADKSIDRMRTFAGFMSWGPGQLENELTDHVWIMAPATVHEVFNTDPEKLWAALHKRWSGSWI